MSDEFKIIPDIENSNSEIINASDSPIPEEVLEKAQKIITDNDEIAAFNKEVLGQLESPLIVHKKGDASYEDCSVAFEMNETHNEEVRPTLKRHRFKKTQKKRGGTLKVFVVVVVVLASVFAGLCYSGTINISNIGNSATESTTDDIDTTQSTTSIEEKYKGTIVVKKNYIFVDGVEVDGIDGLQKALKYKDASTTAYTIIIEGTADDFSENFYNYEVYPYLLDLGFIGDDTNVEHIHSTGLISENETTTKPTNENTTNDENDTIENSVNDSE